MNPASENLQNPFNLFSEIISKTAKKRPRGRPRKYASRNHQNYLKKILGDTKRSSRQQQNYVCAALAMQRIEKTENGAALRHYFERRQTLLAEIGRLEPKLQIKAAALVYWHQLKGEMARAEIRKIRFGDRWRDPMVLSRKIWKAICEYRNRYPYMTDAEVIADLKMIAGALPHDIEWNTRQRERLKK